VSLHKGVAGSVTPELRSMYALLGRRIFVAFICRVANAAELLLHKRLKDRIGTVLVEFDADFGPKVIGKII